MKTKIGTIGFEDYCVSCIIGDLPAEREQEQNLFIDLKVETDFTKCAKTDLLENTVCYVTLAEICNEIAQKNQYRLLETLAAAILDAILKRPKVLNAWIRIKKPDALIGARYTFVEMSDNKHLN